MELKFSSPVSSRGTGGPPAGEHKGEGTAGGGAEVTGGREAAAGHSREEVKQSGGCALIGNCMYLQN